MCLFRFCFVPSPHTAPILAKILMDCLSHYSLDNKISSVVLDNATTNDAMMSILKDNLESNFLMLGGEFLHLRCSAHILNLVVGDGLKVISHATEKVRDCIVFWMSTPKRVEKFDEACRLLNITKPKRLVLDCKTRWNSTYLMLQTALPFKDVFTKLKRLNRKLKFVPPSEHDWMLAGLVCEKLEIFYKATKVFYGRNHPTSNLFFRKICEIKLALRRWIHSDVEVIRTMADSMIEKFDKYGEHVNGILAIATILDPRNKLDCVEHYFKRLYVDDAEKELKRVRENLDKLIVEYQKRNEGNNSED
ncbi:zinc finger BED domain-containing protein RICESLEEPER 2-like [Salvia miltiorrhiza]|uniref:zinc finger BED domain-containing protein RICESLEEPER 2-like n=1 Tax=Salvia miltiorrhiza TaxID=226208 RepID=UPI0025ABAB2B|nr:zinc finger BED domain-containing protein RICESLEEPER 2-like [Salvia miltiorrhiza]